jgi:hypothetical protein
VQVTLVYLAQLLNDGLNIAKKYRKPEYSKGGQICRAG